MSDVPLQPSAEALKAMFGSDVIRGRPVTDEEIANMAKIFAKNPSTENSIPGSINSNVTPKASKTNKVNNVKAFVFNFVRNTSRKIRRLAPKILQMTAAGTIVVAVLVALTIAFWAFFNYLMGISTILAWSVVGALVAQAMLMVAGAVLSLWARAFS